MSSGFAPALLGRLRRSARATLLCAGLAVPLYACSLGPSVTGGPTTPPHPSSTGATASGRATYIKLSLEWGTAPISLAPGAVSCGPGGARVTIRGTFWLDTAVLSLSGLRLGHIYNFTSRKGAGAVAVALTLTGPVTPLTTHLRPEGGLADQADSPSGELSVAKMGKAGSLDVQSGTAPVTISGHWSCAPSQPTVPATLPVLSQATGPPAVGECWLSGQVSPDDDVTPVSCANGDVNVWAWLGDTYPDTLVTLGPGATATEVKSALCDLIEAGTGADVVDSDYQIVQIYYGWQLAVTPQTLISTDACSS
jgi:hypothetical protein